MEMRAESQFIHREISGSASPAFPRSRLDRVPAVYLANFFSARRRGASKKLISRLARETDLSREKKGKVREMRTERNRRRAKGKSSSTPLASSRSFVWGSSEIKPGKNLEGAYRRVSPMIVICRRYIKRHYQYLKDGALPWHSRFIEIVGR